MLVKTLDIPTDEELTAAGYTDEIPQWLQPYVAAALRSGITAGLPEQETFGANTIITGAEADQMLRNALDLTAEEVFAQDADTALTRGEAANILYRAAKMAKNAGKTEIV